MAHIALFMHSYRNDFPILHTQVHGRPLVYLDNAATTQKPRQVVEATDAFYYTSNANVHRGVHHLSQRATDLHEGAREVVRRFINAPSTANVIFTRGTTESINLVAASLGQCFKEGDEVVLTHMEHHSNIVPWQLLRERVGIVLKVVPLHEDGTLDLEAYRALLTPHTRLVSCVHVSNVLGTINPVADMIRWAHEAGALFLLDAAQSIAHCPIDVQALDCDFLAFSGHKVYAPTGIGVLYGKEDVLNRMPPYQGGGEMIARVSFERTTYERLPFKFEAGTPDYVATHGLATALEYLEAIGLERIAQHENELTTYATQQMLTIPGLRIYGTAAQKTSVIAFNVEGIHPMDLGTLLDRLGFAIRTGHHCAQPLMARYEVEGMARISFALYNTREEIDAFIAALKRVVAMF